MAEAKQQGRLGEVAAIETTLAAARQMLQAMHEATVRTSTVHLGMPSVRMTAGRLTDASTTPDVVQP
ncbi:hypothetical protein [Nonomuraea endophytica]|uniref:Uncharacterized protein n=1 Tax=Nonomuraea endophytica TaxID=714136 RepID=A0A7W8AC52_9ACTN|nr:hypothetical protein [Nonomuraea endophytica]MBB5083581.1 hypothetical protein [Nonomuraea endophytica]